MKVFPWYSSMSWHFRLLLFPKNHLPSVGPPTICTFSALMMGIVLAPAGSHTVGQHLKLLGIREFWECSVADQHREHFLFVEVVKARLDSWITQTRCSSFIWSRFPSIPCVSHAATVFNRFYILQWKHCRSLQPAVHLCLSLLQLLPLLPGWNFQVLGMFNDSTSNILDSFGIFFYLKFSYKVV